MPHDKRSLQFEESQRSVDDKGKNIHSGHRARLRKRFLESGGNALADYELLEYLLFSAHARGDTKPLAKALIAKFGSFEAVISASPKELASIKNVSEASIGAIKIVETAAQRLARERVIKKPILSSWQAVISFCRAELANLKHEEFHVLFLDRKNHLIAAEQQSKGTVDQTQVYVREVVKRALELTASALILVHNHPTGDPEPSKADVLVTKEIRKGCSTVGIDVHDHVIIGKTSHSSFKALGLL